MSLIVIIDDSTRQLSVAIVIIQFGRKMRPTVGFCGKITAGVNLAIHGIRASVISAFVSLERSVGQCKRIVTIGVAVIDIAIYYSFRNTS